MRGLIGLTGNIATGKSEVMRVMGALGATVIDADHVARDVVARGQPALAEIARVFGPDVLQPDGGLDRRRLGDIVFNDRERLGQLEAITSPAAKAELWRRVAQAFSDACAAGAARPLILIEVIRLLEGGYAGHCEQVWVTDCPPEEQVARLVRARSLSEADAWARVRAQAPQADKVARADLVIDTRGSLEATRAQVRAAWERLRAA